MIMDIAKNIKICLLQKNIQMKDLAERTNQTQQNLTNKMRSNNFRVSELEEIAAALNARLQISFIDKETGDALF